MTRPCAIADPAAPLFGADSVNKEDIALSRFPLSVLDV